MIFNKKNKDFLAAEKFQTYFLLFVILLYGFFLRSYNFSIQPFWFDEASTVNIAKSYSSFLKMYEYLLSLSEVNPTGYFFFLSLIPASLLENQEVLYRLPSIIFGMLSIFSFFICFRKKIGDDAALFGSWLISILPFFIYYSREARSYNLYILASIWIISAIENNLKNKRTKILYVISFFLISNCHFGGLVFGYISLLFIFFKRKNLRDVIPVGIICTILSAPSWLQLVYFWQKGLNETLFSKMGHFPKLTSFLVEQFINKASFYIHTIFTHRANVDLNLYFAILALNFIPIIFVCYSLIKRREFLLGNKNILIIFSSYILLFTIASILFIPMISARGYLPVIIIQIFLYSQVFFFLNKNSKRIILGITVLLSVFFNFGLNSFYDLNVERNNYRDSINYYSKNRDKSFKSNIFTCSYFNGELYKLYLSDFFRKHDDHKLIESCDLKGINLDNNSFKFRYFWLFNSGIFNNNEAITKLKSRCLLKKDIYFSKSRVTLFDCGKMEFKRKEYE